ncbi:hypothetical protein FOZ62_012358 [Perkinsus olseni]|nr:hypothetical protein FOZ62_012358 [Perkinsus olseni]
MREIPAKKRFIKEFVTKDDRNVEIRMLCSISAKVHWMPEIYYKFGKDFGRGFLEREATIDVEEVVRKYTLEELLEDGEPLDKAIAEIKLRLDDAAAYHKVSFDHAETTIVFVDPEVDDEDEAVISDSPVNNLARDLAGLGKLVSDTAKSRPDLVVLPEASLWGWILGYYNGTDAGDQEARRAGCSVAHHGDITLGWRQPTCTWSMLNCQESSQCEDPLAYLSCLSSLTNVTLVANILHRPATGKQYNTEVAFGPDGAVLQYYHKWHLFGETPAIDQPVTKKLAVFALPQKPMVKVGLLVCYDLLFVSNLLEMVQRSDVSLIAFSTSWASAYPSYNVVMEQQAMARFLGVGIVAANNAAAYSNGGGLYDGTGKPVAVYMDPPSSRDVVLSGTINIPPVEYPTARAVSLDLSRGFARPQQQSRQCSLGTPEITNDYSLDEFEGGCEVAVLRAGHYHLRATSPDGAVECQASFRIRKETADGDSHHRSRVALVAFDQEWVFHRTPDGWKARGCALVSCHRGSGSLCDYSTQAVSPDFVIEAGLELQVTHFSQRYHPPLAMLGYGTGGAKVLPPEDLAVVSNTTGVSWMRTNRPLAELYSAVLYAIHENSDPIEDLRKADVELVDYPVFYD